MRHRFTDEFPATPKSLSLKLVTIVVTAIGIAFAAHEYVDVKAHAAAQDAIHVHEVKGLTSAHAELPSVYATREDVFRLRQDLTEIRGQLDAIYDLLAKQKRRKR